MPTMGEKIRAAREAKGWSQDELADAAGVSQTTIDKIERGVTKRSKFLAYIAFKLNIDASDLDPEMYAAGVPAIAKYDETISYRIKNGDNSLMPLYSSESVENDDGSDGYYIDVPHSPLDFIPKPPFLEASLDAYAIYVSEKMMSPEVEPGDILVFDPRLPFVSDTTCIFIQHGSDLRIIGRLLSYDKESWVINQWGNGNQIKFSRRDFPRLNRAVAKFYRR